MLNNIHKENTNILTSQSLGESVSEPTTSSSSGTVPTSSSSASHGFSATASFPDSSTSTRIYHVAHDGLVQSILDELKIEWGVQWEIARGITTGSWAWHDITREKLEKLIGNNISTAWRVPEVILEKKIGGLNDRCAELWYVTKYLTTCYH